MASTSPPRGQESYDAPEPTSNVGHIPGMGQYRVSMDLGLSSLQGQFEQGDGRMGNDMMAHEQHNQHQHQHHAQHGQFGILTPTPVPHMPMPPQMSQYHDTSAMDTSIISQAETAADGDAAGPAAHGHTNGPGPRVVFNPPDLAAWRQRLFDVDEMIILTEDQYQTYFPHVDNVYSHRSTQRYKRKPFISHYWDCRMKGRPSGTPKSDDPNKKKRKRVARERDLCDVKIKITEYFPGAQIPVEGAAGFVGFQGDGSTGSIVGAGQKFWTIQRVNGNGGNGKGDGVEGPHKHTLERSDAIKKSSVQRLLAKQEKETKKQQKPINRKPTGAALATIKKHIKDAEFKLQASCFCPFSQRVWIALEAKGFSYQYVESDSSAPTEPSDLQGHPSFPILHHQGVSISESSLILNYLEDLSITGPFTPSDAMKRSHATQWITHINSRIVPAFFSWIRSKPPNTPDEALWYAITELVHAADGQGPLFFGTDLSLVDIHLAPFVVRLRHFTLPDPNMLPETEQTVRRWETWINALMEDRAVAATLSGDGLYDDTRALLVEQAVSGVVIAAGR